LNHDLPQEAAPSLLLPDTDRGPESVRGDGEEQLSPSELSALIRLLGDESETVVAAVRQKLGGGGRAIEKALCRATSAEDPRLRMRARDMLADFDRDFWLRRLIRAVSKPHINLESGLFLLANLAAEDFDARPYRRAMDAMASKVRERSVLEQDPRQAVLALPAYLGTELNFTGANTDYHHPDNIHLFRVIERRKGMPLTLAALYISVAQRAGIHAGAVALPGHVLVRLHYGKNRSVIVDPFQNGIVRSRSDCAEYLRKCDLVPQAEWFRDASSEALFLRQLMNLANSNRMRGHRGRARQLKRIAEILAFVQTHRQPALRD